MYSITDVIFLMGLGFSLAAPLGPVNMEMIKRSLQTKLGFILGFLTGLGAMTGDFIIATVVLFVGDEYLREIISNFWIYLVLLSFNVFILAYIGISALRAPAPEKDVFDTDTNVMLVDKESDKGDSDKVLVETKSAIKQYTTGFLIVISSPWSYFWWTSFGGYILNSDLPLGSTSERLLVTIFFLGGILVWVILLCGVLGISRKFASPMVLDIITKGSALLILGFAIKILYDGLALIGLL